MNDVPKTPDAPETPEAPDAPETTAAPAAPDTAAAAAPAPAPGTKGGGLRELLRGRSELGVSALLLVIGLLVLGDALTMENLSELRGPVGPRTVPLILGGGLLVVAAVLAADVLRGGRGEAETGEDVDLAEPADWRTVAELTGVFLAFAALIDVIGFPIAGALLFWGSAYVLGSRNFTRDPLIAAVLSFATFALFNTALGVPLPGGPLMGVI